MMKTAIVSVLGLALALGVGCSKPAKANVNCKGAAAGMSCEVAETEGDAKIKVCWDIKATCKNGTVVSGKGNCGEVSGGGKSTVDIPAAKLENDDKCDSAEGMTIENLVVSAL